MCNGNRLTLPEISSNTSYVFGIAIEEQAAENFIQASLSGILAHKGGSIAILSDNETQLKNKAVNEASDQLSIKKLFSNPFHPEGNSRIDNVYNFLK